MCLQLHTECLHKTCCAYGCTQNVYIRLSVPTAAHRMST